MILKNYYHLSVMIVLWFYVKKESPYLLEIKLKYKDFPGSSVVKTPCIKCRGHEFDPLPCSGN